MDDSTSATAVIDFGAAAVVSDDGLIQLELDDELNTSVSATEEVEVKTEFVPGDDIYFLIHVDNSIKVESVRATDGVVQALGSVLRSKEQRLLFTHEEPDQELNYFPAGGLDTEWYGNEASLSVEKRTVKVGPGSSQLPALADVIFGVGFLSYKLVAPSMELAYEEEYPIQIVVRYQAK